MAIQKGIPMQGSEGLKITALSLVDVAALLSRVGGKPVTAEMIREDIAAGAPQNPDGTMNLIQYAAWLVREVTRDA
jgi:hypothetical protein